MIGERRTVMRKMGGIYVREIPISVVKSIWYQTEQNILTATSFVPLFTFFIPS